MRIAVTLAVLLAGCTTYPVPTDDARSVTPRKWAEHGPDTVTLVVKRDRGMLGAACDTRVYVDGHEIGQLSPREKLTVYLPKGEHLVGARAGSFCGGALSESIVTLTEGRQSVYRISLGDGGAIYIQPTAF